jgi:hypothetical protein
MIPLPCRVHAGVHRDRGQEQAERLQTDAAA